MGKLSVPRLRAFGVGILAAVAISVAALAWIRRVDLFVIPGLWREARALADLLESRPDDPAFAPNLNRELNQLDWTLSTLIRLQRSGFKGGRGFGLTGLVSREGRPVFVAHCDPLNHAFDSPVEDGEEIVTFYCGCAYHSLFLFDSSGCLRREPLGVEINLMTERDSVYARLERRAGVADVLRVSARADCGRCATAEQHAETEYSADSDGLVPHGRVTDDELGAPICPREPGRGTEPDDAEVSRLLASRSDGDLHRALSLLERASLELIERAEPLVRHEDGLIRARAVALLGRHREVAREMTRVLVDPDPRVRFASVEALSGTPGWEESALSLTNDPHPVVLRRAWVELLHSEDDEIAGRAAIELARARVKYVQYVSHCRLASTELAEAIVGWLEADPLSEELSSLELNLRSAASSEMLRPLVGRLVALYREREAYDHSRQGDLAQALVKADDSLADEAVLAALTGTTPGEHNPGRAILLELLRRRSPFRSPGATLALQTILQTGGPCPECDTGECQELAALILVRQGSFDALRWLLGRCAANSEPGFPPLKALRIAWNWQGQIQDCETEAALGLPVRDGKRFRDRGHQRRWRRRRWLRRITLPALHPLT